MKTNVLIISSDSEDTIIESTEEVSKKEIPQTFEEDDNFRRLYNKYLGEKKSKTSEETLNQKSQQNLYEVQSVNKSNKHNYELQSKRIMSENLDQSNSCYNESLSCHTNKKRFKPASEDDVMYSLLNSKDKASKMSVDKKTKEQEKLEKVTLQQEKLKLRQQKKEEEQRNKAIKEALANHYKNIKPENCIKFIKVQIDETLANEDFAKNIIGELQQNGISYMTTSQDISSIITWKTQLDSHILDIDGQLIDTSNGTQIDEVLLILKWNDLLIHIHNETFLSYVKNITVNLKGRKIILAIYGLGKYYQYQKRNKNREFKEDISGKASNNRDQRIYGNVPTVSRRAVEYALTEIQLLYSISHRMFETEQDIALFVFQLTKSIAQMPYKKRKQEEFIQSRWFLSEDNKNCIRVDKNGNGLLRLWKQIITIFPLASLETAEAISAVYPTPLSLFQAYENTTSTAEGEKLLQDISIRRAAGPVSTMRKIGPELSKKMYYFFTSIDSDQLL